MVHRSAVGLAVLDDLKKRPGRIALESWIQEKDEERAFREAHPEPLSPYSDPRSTGDRPAPSLRDGSSSN